MPEHRPDALYYDTESKAVGTVALDPGLFQIWFYAQPGAGFEALSPGQAHGRLRRVVEGVKTSAQGYVEVTWINEPIDWLALLNAQPEKPLVPQDVEQTIQIHALVTTKGKVVSYLDAYTGLVGPVFLGVIGSVVRFQPDGAKANDPNFAFTVEEAAERLRRVNDDPMRHTEKLSVDYWNALLDAQPDFLDQMIADREAASPGFADKVETALDRRVAARTNTPAWLPDDWTAGGNPGTYFGPSGEEVYMSDKGWAVATGVVRENPADLDLDLCSLVFALAHPGQATRSFRPTFAGLAEFADAGFLQEVNRLVLHPSGRALSFTSDKETGAILDVTIWVSDDPAGIAFLPDADEVLGFMLKSEHVAKEIADRSAARLADPALNGRLIELVPGLGLDYEAVAFPKSDPDYVRGVDLMVEQTKSFLLSDDVLNASQRQTGAHDAAMRILGAGGKDPDPRATMRGEIERLSGEVERLRAFESAFLAVNELAPPSDWLRDLRACQTAEDFDALRKRANLERLRRAMAEDCGPIMAEDQSEAG